MKCKLALLSLFMSHLPLSWVRIETDWFQLNYNDKKSLDWSLLISCKLNSQQHQYEVIAAHFNLALALGSVKYSAIRCLSYRWLTLSISAEFNLKWMKLCSCVMGSEYENQIIYQKILRGHKLGALFQYFVFSFSTDRD